MASGHGVDKPRRENDPNRRVERGNYGQELDGWQVNAAAQKSSGNAGPSGWAAHMRSIGMGHMLPAEIDVPNEDYTERVRPHGIDHEPDYEEIVRSRAEARGERRAPIGDTW